MDKRYKHLDGEERGVILAEHRRGASLREIGELMGRAPSTIGRELRRGRPDGLPAQPYCAHRGGLAYRARRKHCGRRRKLALGGWLHDFVQGKLIYRRWSPEQIARKLRTMHPEDPTRQISHETIYAAIYAQPRGGLKAEMLAALRQAKPARGLRRTTLSGGSIAPESLRIIHRPEEIEGRLVPGHWEGDLIKGAFNRSAVGTVVERKTRYLILSKMRGCTADAALEGFTRQMKRLASDDYWGLIAAGLVIASFTSPKGDNQTSATLLTQIGGVTVAKKVRVGAADSGGTGYRMLRVEN